MPTLGLGKVSESSRECWILPICYVRLRLPAEGTLGRRKAQVPLMGWNKLLNTGTVTHSAWDDPGQCLLVSELQPRHWSRGQSMFQCVPDSCGIEGW